MVHTGSVVVSDFFDLRLPFPDIINLLLLVLAILREAHVPAVSQDSLPLKAVHFIMVDYLICEHLYSVRVILHSISMFITKLTLVGCNLNVARSVLWDCTITDLSIIGLWGREILRTTF